jgi:hypothetical protein
MSWKEGFYQAVKEYVNLPEDAVVTHVEEYAGIYYEGCDTCGHGSGQDFEITVSYTLNGKNHSTSIDGKLGDFINSL